MAGGAKYFVQHAWTRFNLTMNLNRAFIRFSWNFHYIPFVYTIHTKSVIRFFLLFSIWYGSFDCKMNSIILPFLTEKKILKAFSNSFTLKIHKNVQFSAKLDVFKSMFFGKEKFPKRAEKKIQSNWLLYGILKWIYNIWSIHSEERWSATERKPSKPYKLSQWCDV